MFHRLKQWVQIRLTAGAARQIDAGVMFDRFLAMPGERDVYSSLEYSWPKMVKTVLKLSSREMADLESEIAQTWYSPLTLLKNIGNDELRGWFIDTVALIAAAEVPVLAMRRALMENVKVRLSHSTLWSDELFSHREQIYQNLNSNQTDNTWNDEFVAISTVWSEAQSICLRHLQNAYFEKAGPDDWWSLYVELNRQWAVNFYNSLLHKNDPHDLNRLLFKACDDARRDYERRIEEGAPTFTVAPATSSPSGGDL